MINYQNAKFLISAASVRQFPVDEGAEVAFIGRSNVGKSSALNALTRQKKLARTSKTPGRTQLINFFQLDEQKRLVDLPGYGYAKVSESIRKNWQALIDEYLRKRNSLRGLILLMDIRHPMQPFEIQMISWTNRTKIPVHVLLTKADKLSYGARLNRLQQVRQAVAKLSDHVTVQVFSSLQKIGRDELHKQLDNWFPPLKKGD